MYTLTRREREGGSDSLSDIRTLCLLHTFFLLHSHTDSLALSPTYSLTRFYLHTLFYALTHTRNLTLSLSLSVSVCVCLLITLHTHFDVTHTTASQRFVLFLSLSLSLTHTHVLIFSTTTNPPSRLNHPPKNIIETQQSKYKDPNKTTQHIERSCISQMFEKKTC